MKLKKYILTAFVALGAVTTLTGCGDKKPEVIKVVSCTPKDKYNDNNSLEFVVDEKNNNVIKKFIYQEGYTKAYMDKWEPDLDKEKAFELASEKAKGLLAVALKDNEHIEWIDGTVNIDKDNYKISTRIVVDVSHEDFEVNEDTMKFLAQFGFDRFYNEDEKRFEVYTDIVEKSTSNSWMPLKCKLIDVPNK